MSLIQKAKDFLGFDIKEDKYALLDAPSKKVLSLLILIFMGFNPPKFNLAVKIPYSLTSNLVLSLLRSLHFLEA